MKNTGISMTITLIVLILSSCTIAGAPTTPLELAASQDLHEKIELTWKDTAGAGVYYVYRSLSDNLTADDECFLGSAAVTAFIDTAVETDVTYYYAVSAADPFGNNETPLSESVSGIAPDLIWSDPQTVASSLSGAVFAGGGTVPMVLTASSGTNALRHYKYDEDTGWTAAAASPGTTGQADYISAAVIGGSLYAAFSDTSDNATVSLYNESTGWEAVGSSGSTTVAGPISLTGSMGFPNNELVISYIHTVSTVSVLTFPGTTYEWTEVGSVGVGLTDSTTANILIYNDGTYIAYEDTDVMGSMIYNENTLAWDALASPGAGNITDGFLSCLSGDDGIYLAFSNAANTISVMQYAEGSWESLAAPSNGATTTSGLLDLEVLSGTLYLACDESGDTVVKQYTDGVWSDTAGDPGSNASSLDLEAFGGSLYLLSYTASGAAEVRILE